MSSALCLMVDFVPPLVDLLLQHLNYLAKSLQIFSEYRRFVGLERQGWGLSL